MRRRAKAALLAVIVGSSAGANAQDRVAETVHNLSTSGPGRIRAESEGQICIFCHAPHNTQGVRPLWNRDLPVSSYQIYQSSTLDARPGQPTGASKLCLSCHDGTIALGSVLSRADQIRMTGGDFLPAGLTNLGTDLSDDHPISFHYTAGLAASDPQLVTPSALPYEVRLDAAGQLQCTSCHDPHHNVNGNFLVRPDAFGVLCTSCHSMTGWSGASHRTASAVVPAAAADWPYATVAENACRSCHRSHTAGGHERLLIFQEEEGNCLSCHDGSMNAANIRAELDKRTAHDPRNYLEVHDPVETFGGGRAHVECTDCHNPHAAASQPPGPPYIPIGATLRHVGGVTIGGAQIADAQYEYEVCFRCHADGAVTVSQPIVRLAHTSNLRLKFSPGNPSFHPLAASSPSTDTVSLVPGLPRGSRIRCTDCHNNDTGRGGGGGGGPSGPHGSNYDYLLERNYTVRDGVSEAEGEYELCYKCHQRSSILSDESFSEHRKHIVEERSPCSACHDPHGVTTVVGGTSDRTHLINFDTRIVRPDPESGRLEFRDRGRFAGSCTLVCHGERHRDEDYSR
ncbi:MAG: hypothetical protein HY763_04140 [Planctomycetes bacterium]|nr:hypothetical protein [Planctomycetota bacterium]